jgi:hypothetical protein
MSSSVASVFARKMQAAAFEASRGADPALRKAGLVMKTVVEASIRSVAPSGRLRGVGRAGARVGVRYDLLKQGGRNGVRLRATGPLHLVERSTKPRDIQPRARRARTGRAALRFSDGSFRPAARHPGTRGKAPFGKGIERAIPAGTAAVRGVMVDAVRKGIRA